MQGRNIHRNVPGKVLSKFSNCKFIHVRKEIKCSGDSEILHEIVRDMYYTTNQAILSYFRVVVRTISCSILESPLQIISFLTAQNEYQKRLQKFPSPYWYYSYRIPDIVSIPFPPTNLPSFPFPFLSNLLLQGRHIFPTI